MSQSSSYYINNSDSNHYLSNSDLIQRISAVAKEKGIKDEIVFDVIKKSIQAASRKKYGYDTEIDVAISKTGEVKISRILTVVENVEDLNKEISFEYAKEMVNDIKIGDFLHDPLPSIELGRVAAQTAKQVIIKEIQDAVSEEEYNLFQGKIGTVVNVVVMNIELSKIFVEIVNSNGVKAILHKNDSISNENIKVNDKIRAYIKDIVRDKKGPQIILSRTHAGFLQRLLEQEVPEIYDGLIQVKAIAREAGSKAKIAVSSSDGGVDVIGACIGVRGSRIQAVTKELNGEKIDILEWSPNLASFIAKALAPAEILRVNIDQENRKVEAIVDENHLSLAIGRRGQNVRLASNLTGWKIDVMTSNQEVERKTEEVENAIILFSETLQLDETTSRLLISHGLTSLESIANSTMSSLERIEGFDQEKADVIQRKAIAIVGVKQKSIEEPEEQEVEISEEFAKLFDMDEGILIKLISAGVSDIEDLKNLDAKQLSEITDYDIETCANILNSI